MADTKRKFYNTGDAKGFTKAVFFAEVKKLAEGDEVDDAMMALIAAAADYEIEGIGLRSETKGTGEKKDPMESDYAKALAAAIVPLITADAKTAKELIALATKSGKLAPSGKEFAAPWVSRVLNEVAKDPANHIAAIKKVVEKTDAKGLKAQAEVSAYQKV